MADYSSYGLISFVLATILALAMTTQPSSSTCAAPRECEVNLSFYMHQVASGPAQNQQVVVSSSSSPQGFGAIAVQDWTIIETPEPDAAIVGHVKGMHVQADQANKGWSTSYNIVFDNGRFKGSTFQVMGIDVGQGQLAIIGGTGQFATARGTMNTNMTKASSVENYRLVDIHAYVLQAGTAAGKPIL